MSVWSRSHNDLAKLAKDLQQLNHRTKSNAANRATAGNDVRHHRHLPTIGDQSTQKLKILPNGISKPPRDRKQTEDSLDENELSDVTECEKDVENNDKKHVLFESETKSLSSEKMEKSGLKENSKDQRKQPKSGGSLERSISRKVFAILQEESEDAAKPSAGCSTLKLKQTGNGQSNKLGELLRQMTEESAKHKHVKKTIESIMALKAETKLEECNVKENNSDPVNSEMRKEPDKPELQPVLDKKYLSSINENCVSPCSEDDKFEIEPTLDKKYLSINGNCASPCSELTMENHYKDSECDQDDCDIPHKRASSISSKDSEGTVSKEDEKCLEFEQSNDRALTKNQNGLPNNNSIGSQTCPTENIHHNIDNDKKPSETHNTPKRLHQENCSLNFATENVCHTVDEDRKASVTHYSPKQLHKENGLQTFSSENIHHAIDEDRKSDVTNTCISLQTTNEENFCSSRAVVSGDNDSVFSCDQSAQHKWVQDEYNKALLKSRAEQNTVILKSPISCSSSSGIADINIPVKSSSSLHTESVSTDQGLDPKACDFVLSKYDSSPVVVVGFQKSPDKCSDKVLVDESDIKELVADLQYLYVSLSRQKQLEQDQRHAGVQETTEDSFEQLRHRRRKKKRKVQDRTRLKEKRCSSEGDREESSMDSQDSYLELDQEFDKVLADMKPYVLKLPQKTDRQKCAVWIKKLCEPPTSGINGRKNRNMYTQLMLHMLKRGTLEGPFDKKPEDGPLQTLPTYMSIYFDESVDSKRSRTFDDDKVPDWVNGELMESVGSSVFHKSYLERPAASSTWLSSSSGHDVKQRPHSSMGFSLDKERSYSPSRRSYLSREDKSVGFTVDDLSLRNGSATHSISPIRSRHKPVGERKRHQPISPIERQSKTDDSDWSKPYTSSLTVSQSLPRGITFQDDVVGPPSDREIEMRAKMIEAKYHEEKLKLQQKHDGAVQKILDRKNAEIEDVKSHYRGKAKDLEETITKLERKTNSLVKESQVLRETKDKQITELKKLIDETSVSRKSEFDKKLHDAHSEFEQEKFEMQKQHTRNIQEILDDTNSRLQRMEREYTQQTESTGNVIRELESRVQQLTAEVDNTVKQKVGLEQQRFDLEENNNKLNEEVTDLRDRLLQEERDHQNTIEGHEHEMRTLKHKTEASLEFLKQEQTMSAAKAMDTIEDLQQQFDHTKKLLKDTEEQRQRQMRELEQVHQQDKLHLENLHDKQIRSIKKEMEQLEQDLQKKIKKLEQLVQEKEKENTKLQEQNHVQAVQSEKALQEFKSQVEKNQIKVYDDMKQQMEQVETDLNKSKLLREKQSKEFSRQLDEQAYKQERELQEMKQAFDNEKAQLLRDVHVQKEYMQSEHERDMDILKDTHHKEMQEMDTRLGNRHEKDSKTISDLENQVRELREELVQSNQLRKQQLVELGLLREEEKQKMQRDHEAEVSRFRSELDQQRLELQKTHSTEMENMLEKTNQRLKNIEKEYCERGQKSTETVAELHTTISHLRDEKKRLQEHKDKTMSEVNTQNEEDRKSLKKQYSSTLMSLQKELDNHRQRTRNLERQLQKEDSEHEAKVTRLKLSYEEKLRGLIPVEVRQELEDTIESLKSQVNSLQQRAAVLQEELDMRMRTTLGPFGSRTSSPIKSSV